MKEVLEVKFMRISVIIFITKYKWVKKNWVKITRMR